MTNEEAIKRLKEVQAEFNENWVDYGGVNQAFEKAYKALAEKTQGKWIVDGHHIRCNKCNEYICIRDMEGVPIPDNFCPNCGADMRGGAENETDN